MQLPVYMMKFFYKVGTPIDNFLDGLLSPTFKVAVERMIRGYISEIAAFAVAAFIVTLGVIQEDPSMPFWIAPIVLGIEKLLREKYPNVQKK